ncbi:DUF4861 domain-containing protein [Terrimonas pollutisoli]|uniref:DUF4861 domain-containing protein n=1 Tax=Terrimonas pollutisoli TaxID=3034147 RepID=UPI0023EC3F13|nr:DUF4861 domain-containing protein [Terrimonas sp. H1YJ31]
MQISFPARVTVAISGLFFLFLSCNSPAGKDITITNPLAAERPDELIVLTKSVIEAKIGTIPPGKFVLLTTADDKPVLVQYDDMDRDGNWDELAFLYSFKPEEKVGLSLAIADAPAAIKAFVRAHARHRRKNADNSFGNDLQRDSIPAGQPATDFAKQAYPPFLTEGPAWENDKVGFRLYFDTRNGKDIWGKITSRMMMDEIGLDTAKNYHLQADWGMDVLKVGKSLGAGALALSVPMENGKDSLIRLGGVNMGKVVYEKIADGPVRAVIRLHYPAWKLLDNLKPVSLTEEISIWGGQYFYESKVTINGAPGNAKLVTGIVNLHSKESYQVDTANHKILFTFDKQSENKDELGMGIVIPANSFSNYFTTPNEATDIQNTYGVRLKIAGEQPVVFRFYAGWGKSNDAFLSQAKFSAYLKMQALYWEQMAIIN